MPQAPHRASTSPTVLVISSSAETRDGLHAYFSQVGLGVLARRSLNRIAELPGSLRAIVVFPDDYEGHEAAAYLSMVRQRRPELALVVVTREPAVYNTDGSPINAIVLPKPAFGWTILDAIRDATQMSSER
jgi:hypothetical protein